MRLGACGSSVNKMLRQQNVEKAIQYRRDASDNIDERVSRLAEAHKGITLADSLGRVGPNNFWGCDTEFRNKLEVVSAGNDGTCRAGSRVLLPEPGECCVSFRRPVFLFSSMCNQGRVVLALKCGSLSKDSAKRSPKLVSKHPVEEVLDVWSHLTAARKRDSARQLCTIRSLSSCFVVS